MQEKGASIDSQDDEGNTAVHAATNGARVEIVCSMLKHGADLGIRNNRGLTCLHTAAMNKSTQMVTCLVKEGAEVRAAPCVLATAVGKAHLPEPGSVGGRGCRRENISTLRVPTLLARGHL